MGKITLLPHWVLPDTLPSVYDSQSGTALEMVAKVYGAMRTLQEEYNSFADNVNNEITNFINSVNKDQEEFENKINKIMHDYIIKIDEKIKIQDKQIEDTIVYIKENISASVKTILAEMSKNGELSDVVIEALTNVENTLSDVNTTIEDMITRMDSIESNLSDTNVRITEVEEELNDNKIRLALVENAIKATYNSIDEMKQGNVECDSIVKTTGYYECGDGGGANYLIRTKLETDIEDNGSIHFIRNSLVAELIIENEINLKIFGVMEDGITDDSSKIQNAIDYSMDHNDVKLVGNNKYMLVLKTLYFGAYTPLENSKFISGSDGVYDNNYLISVNSKDLTNWIETFPLANKGYFKNVDIRNFNFTNMTPIVSGLNGIFNASNNSYNDMNASGFDISFKSSGQYLDNVKINNFNVGYKVGSEYAIQFGYVGDQCEINSAHIHQTKYADEVNFIMTGKGHNGARLRNIISNGNLFIEGSNISIDNIHQEEGTIKINNAIVNIQNGYLYHYDLPNIDITNSVVNLENILFQYNYRDNSFENASDIDVNINNSDVVINNCFKSVVYNQDVTFKNLSAAKTNLDENPSLKSIKTYNSNSNIPNEVNSNINIEIMSLNSPDTWGYTKWQKPTGTYYYKVIPLLDATRNLRSSLNEYAHNISLTNGESGFGYLTATKGMYRVYRGTSENNYTEYADISTKKGIFDNGYFINGVKWKTRTGGDIDTLLKAYRKVVYNGSLIKCYADAIPTSGTWLKGDIILNDSATKTGDAIGWLCVADGTPGTWLSIGNLG